MIVWLADGPGWAYHAIVDAQSKNLLGYRHECFFVAAGLSIVDRQRLADYLDKAAVVVAMYVAYKDLVPDPSKLAIMLTGHRPFEPNAVESTSAADPVELH